jgi:hypothetical protein
LLRDGAGLLRPFAPPLQRRGPIFPDLAVSQETEEVAQLGNTSRAFGACLDVRLRLRAFLRLRDQCLIDELQKLIVARVLTLPQIITSSTWQIWN